jgi:ribosomal protein L35
MAKTSTMKKSMTSRIKITRSGKVMRRTMATGHNRTRKSRNNILRKRTQTTLNLSKHTVLTY